ncbi:hypothetical protein [Sphingomonas sp.]|uniref:hypothetical protein n=1 Tax=Sphingomonas sp. TaxID=28214 RepID=UPI0035B2CD1C
MTLLEWMKSSELEIGRVASRLNCTAEAVRRYIKGDRIPSRDVMRDIFEISGGKVTPNDFYLFDHAAPDTAVVTASSLETDASVSQKVPA